MTSCHNAALPELTLRSLFLHAVIFGSDQNGWLSNYENIEDELNTVYVNHLQRHSITGSMSAAKPLSSLTDKRPSYTDISMPGNKNY